MRRRRQTDESLHLPQTLYGAICRHVVSNPSVEVCGLLAGVGGTVSQVYPVSNVAAAPAVSYYMDPLEQLAALKEIDRLGLNLVGVYHSHPAEGYPTPSATDLRQALGQTMVYLILVPGTGSISSCRAFRLLHESYVEVPVIVGSSSAQHP